MFLNNKFCSIIILIIIFSSTHLHLFSQNNGFRPLKVGDTIPNVILKKVFNHTATDFKISDFKGKLLIIDFWATWCGPCIAEFPKIDSLQKEFKDDIFILPVSDEKQEIVADFWTNYSKGKNIKLPSITEDKILNYLFPHASIPHEVWINGNGKIIAITGAQQLSRANIRDYMAKKTLTLSSKIYKPLLSRDNDSPLIGFFINTNDNSPINNRLINKSDLMAYSVFTKRLPNIQPNGFLSNKPGIFRMQNVYAFSIISEALFLFDREIRGSNRVIWEVKNVNLKSHSMDSINQTVKLESDSMKEDYKNSHLFCFEFYDPEVKTMKDFSDKIASTVNDYFGRNYGMIGVLEKRSVTCYVFTRLSNDISILTTQNKQQSPLNEIESSHDKSRYALSYTDKPFGWLFDQIKLIYQVGSDGKSLPPLVNETGYHRDDRIDISLRGAIADLSILNKELEKYGLRIEKKIRTIDMVVIKDTY